MDLTVREIATFLAVATSLGLAAVALVRPRSWIRASFGIGMLALASQSLAGYVLLGTFAPEDRIRWAGIFQAIGLAALVPWGVFVAGLVSPAEPRPLLRWRLSVALGCGAVGAMAVVAATLQTFESSDIQGPFYAAQFGTVGRYGVAVELLATVAILAGLEASLRASTRQSRWRIKYLILGLGGIFLLRFYLSSQMLMFQVLMPVYVTTASVTLALGNAAVAISLIRDRFRGAEMTVSRHLVYRSVVVGVLGCYLLVVGALGWLLSRLGVAEEMFWGSLVVFVSALALAAVLLSEDVRWRIKRFIGLNFYRSKYDYREQWIAFTKRLASLVTLEEIAPQLLGAVVESVGAARAALYLADAHDGHYRLAGALGPGAPPAVLDGECALVARVRQDGVPVALGAGANVHGGDVEMSALPQPFLDRAVAVPLRWRGALVGLMLLGPERAGQPYTAEDFEFLATIAEQAAGVIVTARLSESLVQSREFEAFHRLTSFVIHDLKNSVSTLSMLSHNALQHFDNPDFQRDAITTLSRTADRMRALLARLSSAPDAAQFRFQSVDLAALAQDAAVAIAIPGRIRLSADLARVPDVSGDRDALLRVLQNLVTNALEAIEGEGAISVRTYREGPNAVFAISDSGCGMAEEFLRKKLFTPFRTTKKGGWGIGLYHAKEIVEGHGGRIEVDSRQGEGTRFRVLLPIAPRGHEETPA